MKLLFITSLFALTVSVHCAKILGVFHVPSKSHHILGDALLQALAERGHEVTMLSPFPLKSPVKNYNDIALTSMLQFKEDDSMMKLMLQQNMSIFEKLSTICTVMHNINDHFFNHPAVQNLIQSKSKFDVVIQSYFGNDVYFGLPYTFDASSIAFTTIGSNSMTNQLTGNSAPYSYVPNLFPPLPDEMTFLQRVSNTLIVMATDIYYHCFLMPEQDRLLKKHFPQAPPVQELTKNVSLVLLNSHYSIESPRPHVPNMIQVGGLQVGEPRNLTGDLKEWMDTAEEGVIFFSLGSNVKSADLPLDKLEDIVATFSKLPMKVLWKFEREGLKLPANVKIGKWLPQRDILAHPNTKLFITHGGLLSTTEAIYFGVPMVGIPFFGDQDRNVDDGVAKNYLVKVPFLQLSNQTLSQAIRDVLQDSKYSNNVKQRSSILRDQPLKPIDNAVFWVEYVIRHKGAHHLKTSAIKLKWYQYLLLDVLALIFVILLTFIVLIYFILRGVFKLSRKMFTRKEPGKSISKQQKKSKLA